MQSLIQRTRLAMNLLLLTSLFIFWGAIKEKPDLKPIVKESFEKAELFLDPSFPAIADFCVPKEVQFYHSYNINDDLPAAWEIEKEKRNTRIKDVIGMRRCINDQIKEKLLEAEKGSAFDKLDALEKTLTALAQAFSDSRLPLDSTIGDLLDYTDYTKTAVRIPIIDEYIDLKNAFPVYSIAAMLIMLYLISCAYAIYRRCSSETADAGIDWLFFHPGFLGVILGAMWIFFPAFIIVFGIIRGAYSGSISFITAAILLAESTIFMRYTLRARKKQKKS